MKKLTFAVAILLLTVVLGACTDKTDSSHDAKQDEEQMLESLSVKDFAGTWVMSINEAHYTVLIKDDGTGVVTKQLYDRVERANFKIERRKDGEFVTKSDHYFADGWLNYLTCDRRHLVIEQEHELYALKQKN